jgi:hypothetical protein
MAISPQRRRLSSLRRNTVPTATSSTSIVIRPSGVWNSRAPFTNYFLANRQIGLHFNVLILSACYLRSLLRRQKSDRAIREIAEADRIATFALLGYRKSIGKDAKGQRRKPTCRDFETDVTAALQDLYEAGVVKVASLFESFALCWALNSLLARLERGERWSQEEQRLCDQLSPIISERVPSWYQIMRAFPTIADELRYLPHIYLDKKTKEQVKAPVSSVLNAGSVIEFWREYRNLVVHRGAIVSSAFHDRFEDLYNELIQPLGSGTPALRPRRPVSFSDALVRAMATTHYFVATHLAKRLTEFSHRRRGHLNAPGPELELLGTTLAAPKQLLIEGDHDRSLRWTLDINFCRKAAPQLQHEGFERGFRPPPLPPELAMP